MMPAPVALTRETSETRVELELGRPAGETLVETGLPFFDHLLAQLVFYWGTGLRLRAREFAPLGDGHHLAEDVALALGRALDERLGDRSGLARYGQRLLPMDEALATAAVDLGGRPFAVLRGKVPRLAAGGFDGANAAHFFRTFAAEARLTLHLSVRGHNAHHVLEASCKALGLALAEACAPSGSGVRSTKGVLR